MKEFTNPARGIKALILAIIISSTITLIIQTLAAQDDDIKGLNMLGWMLEPAIFVAIYLTLARKWKTAGLSLQIEKLKYWFLFALCLPLALSGSLLLINHITGYVALKPEAMRNGAIIASAGFGIFIFKNIVEEFVFRGFLTTRFAETSLGRINGHILTGIIWASWHLVYWFALLPTEKIAEVSGLPIMVFVILGFVALMLQSILFGELRLITGSIWVGVVLHTMNNLLLAGLVGANAVPTGSLISMVLTPLDFGLIYAGIFAFIGLLIWRRHAETNENNLP